jgi:hypothetical protein
MKDHEFKPQYSQKRQRKMKLDVVMPICNHSIHQAEARRL